MGETQADFQLNHNIGSTLYWILQMSEMNLRNTLNGIITDLTFDELELRNNKH